MIPTLLQAAVWGSLHALTPCAHSWPMLVPVVARGRAMRAAILFGSGKVVSSVALGALAGGAIASIPDAWQHRAEEITGGLLIGLGLFLLLRPRAAHLGHLHGECDPAHDPSHGAACEHPKHSIRRFDRLGPALGLFVLGAINMIIPCWTNVAAVGLAASAGSIEGGMLVFGVYGASAAIVMTAILASLQRAFQLASRLGSGRFEAWVTRLSSALLVVFGLTLVFHWHEHG